LAKITRNALQKLRTEKQDWPKLPVTHCKTYGRKSKIPQNHP